MSAFQYPLLHPCQHLSAFHDPLLPMICLRSLSMLPYVLLLLLSIDNKALKQKKEVKVFYSTIQKNPIKFNLTISNNPSSYQDWPCFSEASILHIIETIFLVFCRHCVLYDNMCDEFWRHMTVFILFWMVFNYLCDDTIQLLFKVHTYVLIGTT